MKMRDAVLVVFFVLSGGPPVAAAELPQQTSGRVKGTDLNGRSHTYLLRAGGIYQVQDGREILLAAPGNDVLVQGTDADGSAQAYVLNEDGSLYVVRGARQNWLLLHGPGACRGLAQGTDANGTPQAYALHHKGGLDLLRSDPTKCVLLHGPGACLALAQGTDANGTPQAYALSHTGELDLLRSAPGQWVLLHGPGACRGLAQGTDANGTSQAYALNHKGGLDLLRSDPTKWLLIGGPGACRSLVEGRDEGGRAQAYFHDHVGAVHLLRSDPTKIVTLFQKGPGRILVQGRDDNKLWPAAELTTDGHIRRLVGAGSEVIAGLKDVSFEIGFHKIRPLIKNEVEGMNSDDLELTVKSLDAVRGGVRVACDWKWKKGPVKDLCGSMTVTFRCTLDRGTIALGRVEILNFDCPVAQDLLDALVGLPGVSQIPVVGGWLSPGEKVVDLVRDVVQGILNNKKEVFKNGLNQLLDDRLAAHKELNDLRRDCSARFLPGRIVIILHNANP